MTSGLMRMCRSWTGLAAILLIGVVTISAGGCRRGRRGTNGTSGSDAEDWNYHRTGLVGSISASEYPGDDQGYFDEGDTVTFTVTVTDENGFPIDINTENLVADRLYIYGPLDQSKTVTCQNLLHTTSPSAYVHLATDDVEWLRLDSNVATFETGEITDEEPGTYRAVVWLTSATETWSRTVVYTEFQIKTPVVETETVAATQCAPCHLGADSGKYYFHHIDPGYSPTGNFELDQLAVVNCKACHNQSGYANTSDNWVPAYTKTPDPIIRRVHGVHMGEELKSPRNTHRMALQLPITGSFGPAVPGDPASTPAYQIKGLSSGATAKVKSSDGSTYLALGHVTGEFLIDEIVEIRRLPYVTATTIPDLTKTSWSNGVSIGTAKVLASTIYDSAGGSVDVAVQAGYFADYTTVVFPPDVRNCTKCHIDDNWKNKPSKAACSACHDNLWWGDDTLTPEGFRNHEFEIGDIVAGVPGSDMNQDLCNGCHSESTFSIATAHEVPEWYQVDQSTPTTQAYSIELDMSPPGPLGYYVAGDTPKVYVTIIDNATGLKVDPTMIGDYSAVGPPVMNKWNGMSLQVGGPRGGHSVPVLTTAATKAQYSATAGLAGPYTFLAGDTLILNIDNAAVDTVLTPGAVTLTAAAFCAWINPSINPLGATAYVSSNKVVIKTKKANSSTPGLNIKLSAVQTKMGFDAGRVSNPSPYNDLRHKLDALWDTDPKVAWVGAPDYRIEYQLDDVVGLTPGTYHMYVNGNYLGNPEGYDMLTFQVGTATEDAFIARNCEDCHGDRHMHLDAAGRHPVDFSTDYCKNCHDWKREAQAANAWDAYSADIIVKKVHGIHNGHYLQYPEKIYVNNPIWGGIIFPQDVRNCSKCHDSGTTGTWNTEPSRVACGSCHDSDETEAHLTLMTVDPTPTFNADTNTGGPFSGDEVESCKACHGEGNEFEALKVHNISDPYVPPYPREKE